MAAVVTIRSPCADAALPEVDEIVELCRIAGDMKNQVLYPAESPRFFIKYGTDVEKEARTQDYVRRNILGAASPPAPRVPQIYLAFRQSYWEYAVMDYVPHPTVAQ